MNHDQHSSEDHQELFDRLASSQSVPREYVRKAMQNPNFEMQAAVFNFIMEPSKSAQITPALDWSDYFSFVPLYLERCIVENPEIKEDDPDELVLSRWAACHEFSAWFRWLWENPAVPRSAVTTIKERIEKLYIEGDAATRTALIQGMLEHLFENPGVRAFFADWSKAGATLHTAYLEASDWVENGGHSPLWT